MNLTKKQRANIRKAKILLFDLEVSPMLAYTYNYYEGRVLKIVEPQKLLCFSYKWLGDTQKPKTVTLIDKGTNPKDDFWITHELWRLLDEANLAVAHNGARFDGKMANTFFVAHGLKPPAPYKMVDTLTAARQKFKFPSNKLDELGKFLGVGQKTEVTCNDLWEACLEGSEEAYRQMAIYCANDVTLMENIYWKLMPFANVPAINKFINEELVCSKCGNTRLQRKGIVPDTTQGPSWRYYCPICGSSTKVPLTKDEKEEHGIIKPMNRNISGCF